MFNVQISYIKFQCPNIYIYIYIKSKNPKSKYQNLESIFELIYTMLNWLIKEFLKQFQEIKKNYQNSKIKNSMEQIFM